MLYPHNGIFLAMKRNEVLIHDTTWKNLENIMLKKKSITKDHVIGSLYMKPLLTGIQKASRLVFT